MPKKFISCVKKVKKAEKERYGHEKYNPYAVCRVSTGYHGSSHDIGMVHPKKEHCSKCLNVHCKHHPTNIAIDREKAFEKPFGIDLDEFTGY